MNTNPIIHITIKDKNGIVLEEDAYALSSYNEIGIFDVLPLHANFVSIITKQLRIHKGIANKDKDMNIGTGILKVTKNFVNIYLGLVEADHLKPSS